ncbi:MauE/DoxX family redox-associated membrane protein [Streptomyces sp. SID13031]|uniref:MauE/DoxX family redox-associated membrane protein n=1 Tax=Streptomyces sp. SID13031 TaxID=2706046 RepID=UPI0013CD2EC8|nr:MauE/DoxX family redox-associated membrane protein [Streptomyces sp. SID13031]NEA31265.1 methylamine utilization protein MauE [Streptomyces sp. SID13031]
MTEQLMPSTRAGLVMAAVLTIERATVALVAVPATVVPGMVLAFLLLVTFSAAIRSALQRGVRGSCHCFGLSSAPLDSTELVRNGLLLSVCAVGVCADLASSSTAPHPPGVAVSMTVAVVLVVLLIFFDDIAVLGSSGGSPH